MADKVTNDRKKDANINTDPAAIDIDSMMNLDFPGSGDEGLDMGKGRKPSSPKKEFAIEAAKGIGGGVKTAAAGELRHIMPDVGSLYDEGVATINDFKALKDDIGRQIAPIAASVENATRKFLPKVEAYLPKKIYDKISKKLEERAASRAGTGPGPSKEQMESETIRNELAQLFSAQTSTSMQEIKEHKKDVMVDRAIGSVRHKQQTAQLVHIYDAVRSTELFHRTQHVAYMKKSLELKYRHIFIARDTFNLMQQSMKTFEGYLKAITSNTALPDMMKEKASDYVKKARTQRYGNIMTTAIGTVRQKILERIKGSVSDVLGTLGGLASAGETAADMSASMDELGGGDQRSAAAKAAGLGGKLVGWLGGGAAIKGFLNKHPNVKKSLAAFNSGARGFKANFATHMQDLRERMAQGNPLMQYLSDFLPDMFSQQTAASNDMLNKSDQPVPFDVITRQSITEVIPGYLGKIWKEIEMMRTGREDVAEKTYNVYRRDFSSVDEFRSDAVERMMGSSADNEAALRKMIGKLQGAAAHNAPDKDPTQIFKEHEKDINRFLFNHAIKGQILKPHAIAQLSSTGGVDAQYGVYIDKVFAGIAEDKRRELAEVLCNAFFDKDGNLDKFALTDINQAINENMRTRMEVIKTEMPKVIETFGGSRHMGGLVGIHGGKAEMDFDKFGDTATSRINAGNLDIESDGIAKYIRQTAFDENLAYHTGMRNAAEAADKLGANKVGEMGSKAKGWMRRGMAFLMPDLYDEDALAKDATDDALKDKSEDAQAKWRKGTANRMGYLQRDEARKYEDIFGARAAKPEDPNKKKVTAGDVVKFIAGTDAGKAVTGKIDKFGETISGAVDSVVSAGEEIADDFRKGSRRGGIKGGIERVGKGFIKKGKKAVREGKKKLRKTTREVKKTKIFKKYSKKASKIIKGFEDIIAAAEKSPYGKRAHELATFMKTIYEDALKRGEDGIDSLKELGGFRDDDTLSTWISRHVEEFGEDLDKLPPMDGSPEAREAWKQLLISKYESARSSVTEMAEDAKKSTFGQKISRGLDTAKTKATSTWKSLKKMVGMEPEEGAPPPPTSAALSAGEDEERRRPSGGDYTSYFETIIQEIQGWHKEAVDNQGTLFDAVAKIDETLSKMPVMGGGGGPIDPTAAAEAIDPSYRRFRAFRATMHHGLHAAKEGIFGIGRGVAKMYGAAYKYAGNAIGGIGYGLGIAAKQAISTAGKGAKAVGKWLTHKEDYVDVYVKGKEGGMPLVSARKQRDPDEGIFFKSSGKRVERSADIDEPCVDKNGNLVITEEDLKAGLVMNNSTPIGKIGAGIMKLGKGYFGLYGEAIKAIGGVAKTTLKVLFGTAAERWTDVYRKDEIAKGPLVTAKKQREEGVYFVESGKKVERTSDIHEPVWDRDKQMLITKEDVEHGLVDVNNKPLGTGGHGGLIGAAVTLGVPALKAIGGLAKKALGKGIDIYGSMYKNAIELGAGALKGVGKFTARALGLDLSGIGGGGMDEATKNAIQGQYDLMKIMQKDLALIADQYRDKSSNPLDADGDGDIDGSYADQQQNKGKDGEKRVDAKDVHKDVKWGKDKKGKEGEGGEPKKQGWLDKLLDKAKDKMFGKIAESKFGQAASKMWGNIVSKMSLGKLGGLAKTGLGKLGGLVTKIPGIGKLGGAIKGLGIGGKIAGLGAKVMPALGGLGHAAMGALGSAGSAIGGLASSAGTALSGLLGGGGLAGLGSTLAAVAGPAALAALAGYGIYRGVKGFSKKNALENVGKSKGISKENQLTFEDRMASALGMNTKIGAKLVGGAMSINPLVGLIKGIRGNDNPLTDKEIEKGRNKLNNKIKKGLPGYDRILQEYEKAVEAGNWKRARELSGQEADGIIKSLWKHSITGKLVTGAFNFMFGKKDEEMTEKEIQATRDKFNSIINKGGNAGKNAEKLLSKFDDYVAEQDWKNARKIAGMEKRGLFGKLFQDTKGNIKWGRLAGAALMAVPGLNLIGAGILGASMLLGKDENAPMSEKEIKEARDYLTKEINSGNKQAAKILDAFDEAVTEQKWKKARKLVGKESRSIISKLGSGAKRIGKTLLAHVTFGLFGDDNDTPLKEEEIKKFREKMNYLISKGDKSAEKKLEKFDEYVSRQQWEKARKIAKLPHENHVKRAAKATWNFLIGSDDKEVTEQERTKFYTSMQRKIEIGGATGRAAQKKLDAFEDAIGRQNWRKARQIANMPNDGILTKGAKSLGKGIANTFRFFFGGDGKPMSESEIEQARKQMQWAISDGKKNAQKRLDMFEDYIADEKWEKARRLAQMPYENVVKRVGKAIGSFLFGSDKDALTPEEIDKYQKEMEQKIADAKNDRERNKLEKMLSAFNNAIAQENWAKARKISGMKAEGVVQKVGKALNPFNWFKDGYEDCQKLKEEIEDKIADEEDNTGILNKALEQFETLVRRQKYSEAMKLGKDILKMKPTELAAKHKFSTEEFEKLQKQAEALLKNVEKEEEENNGFLHPVKEMQLAALRRNIKNNSDQWSEEFFDEATNRLSEITGKVEYKSQSERPDDEMFKRGQELIKTIEQQREKRNMFTSPIVCSRLNSLKNEVASDPMNWDEETINNWYDQLGEIDDEYKEGRKGQSKESADIEKKHLQLLKDIEASQDKLSGWNPLNYGTKLKLSMLKGRVESERANWSEESLTDYEEQLRELDKDYKSQEERAADANRQADVENAAAEKADEGAIQDDEVGRLTTGSAINQVNIDFYGKDEIMKKPWLADVSMPGDPDEEEAARIAWEQKQSAAKKKAEDNYKWTGKGKGGTDKEATKRTEYDSRTGEHTFRLGNHIDGWEWDAADPKNVVRWYNGKSETIAIEDLDDDELASIAGQIDESAGDRRGTDDDIENKLQNLCRAELQKRGIDFKGRDDDKLKWAGKMGKDGKPVKAKNSSRAERTTNLLGTSTEAHQMLGNKIDGWEWDNDDPDTIIRWKNYVATPTTWKDLSDEELTDLAHQKERYGDQLKGDLSKLVNVIQHKAIDELKNRGYDESWWTTAEDDWDKEVEAKPWLKGTRKDTRSRLETLSPETANKIKAQDICNDVKKAYEDCNGLFHPVKKRQLRTLFEEISNALTDGGDITDDDLDAWRTKFNELDPEKMKELEQERQAALDADEAQHRQDYNRKQYFVEVKKLLSAIDKSIGDTWNPITRWKLKSLRSEIESAMEVGEYGKDDIDGWKVRLKELDESYEITETKTSEEKMKTSENKYKKATEALLETVDKEIDSGSWSKMDILKLGMNPLWGAAAKLKKKNQLKSLREEISSALNDGSMDKEMVDSWKQRLEDLSSTGYKATETESDEQIQKKEDEFTKYEEDAKKVLEDAEKIGKTIWNPFKAIKMATIKTEIKSALDSHVVNKELVDSWKQRLHEIDEGYEVTDTKGKEEPAPEVKNPDDYETTETAGASNRPGDSEFTYESRTERKLGSTEKYRLERIKDFTSMIKDFKRAKDAGIDRPVAVGGKVIVDSIDEKQAQLMEIGMNYMGVEYPKYAMDLYNKYREEHPADATEEEMDPDSVDDSDISMTEKEAAKARKEEKNEQKAEFEKKFAEGGFLSRFGKWYVDRTKKNFKLMGKAGKWLWDHSLPGLAVRGASKIGSLAKGAISKGWDWLKGKFATKPTDEVDADGNPVQYGEAGAEAIMPIESKPGNLVDVIARKVAEILAGKDLGPVASTADEASVHAGTEEAAPMENKLAGELAENIQERMQRYSAQQEFENRFAEGGFFKRLGDVKDLLFNPSKSKNEISDLISSPIKSLREKTIDPFQKFLDSIRAKRAESEKTATTGNEELLKASSGNGDKLVELIETQKKLYDLLSAVFGPEGVKVAGLDSLTQVCAAAGGGEETNNTAVITPSDEPVGGINLRKFAG